MPRVKAEELDDAYRVVAELPGVEAADVDVTVDAGVLTITGKRTFGEPAEDAVNGESFEQWLRFPGEIDEVGVKASLKNGLLVVTIPKLEEAKPDVRTIPVQTA